MADGLGGLANRSVGSLAKALRARMSAPAAAEWYLDPASYTMDQVAERVMRFFYDEIYLKSVPKSVDPPGMGFLIAGYSATSESAEIWKFTVRDGGVADPIQQICNAAQPVEACWEDHGEAIRRLLQGYSWQLVDRLVAAG